MMNEVKGWKLQIQLSSQSNQEIHHKRTRLLETTANDSLKKNFAFKFQFRQVAQFHRNSQKVTLFRTRLKQFRFLSSHE